MTAPQRPLIVPTNGSHETPRMSPRFHYRCDTCRATFTSPQPLERCANIPRGRPCRGSLVLTRKAGK